MTNTSNLPIEALESEYPLLVREYALRQDSGGAGQFLGGRGLVRRLEARTDGLVFSGLADRQQLAPWGLRGGQPGLPGRFTLIKADGQTQILGSKISNIPLQVGDQVLVETPGAGGYGPPQQRGRQQIEDDLRDGAISPGFARQHFAVVE